MTGCYRIRMRDVVGPFFPIIAASSPDEATDKALVIAAELFGTESGIVHLHRPEWLHSSDLHMSVLEDGRKIGRCLSHARRPPHRRDPFPKLARRVLSMQLRGER